MNASISVCENCTQMVQYQERVCELEAVNHGLEMVRVSLEEKIAQQEARTDHLEKIAQQYKDILETILDKGIV